MLEEAEDDALRWPRAGLELPGRRLARIALIIVLSASAEDGIEWEDSSGWGVGVRVVGSSRCAGIVFVPSDRQKQ